MTKRIAILGSTGSIGTNALQVIEHLGPAYRVTALSAHANVKLLAEQAARFGPAAVAVTDPAFEAAAAAVFDTGSPRLVRGADSLVRIVERDDVDVVLASVVGAGAVSAVLRAAELGKTVALANKESLVIAGALVMPAAAKSGAAILPIDSEHSAVFQAMQCGRLSELRRVILTASGGPFRTATFEQMAAATYADALNHPTWRMGNKVTIDSATLFNKALELIEACWLFDLPPERLQIVVHPESIVHSMVEFVDGSMIAHLSPPDMRLPIQYALTYPHRVNGLGHALDLSKALSLRFEPPDPVRFPAVRLAYAAAQAKGTAGAVLNAANEVAVEAFAAGRAGLTEIPRIVEATIDAHRFVDEPVLEELIAADAWARQTATRLVHHLPTRTATNA